MENLIAHRGLKIKGIKENTLDSFKEAIKNVNYAGFECDVRTTKDHIFVIAHNPIIGGEIISLTNYKELKKKHNIPRLEEVLELNTNKIILLEIKEINVNYQQFQKTIHKYSHKNIYVMSFFNSVIEKLTKEKQQEKLGVLNYVLNSEESYKKYDFICLLGAIITLELEKYFQTKNILVFIYGIHDLNKIIDNYPRNYFITDEIIENNMVK